MFPTFAKPTIFGLIHVTYFGVLLPLGVIRRRQTSFVPGKPLPNRIRHFCSAAVGLVVLSGLSLLIAYKENIHLFPQSPPPLRGILAGVILYAVAVIFMRPRWRRAVEQRHQVSHLFMPQTTAERAGWIVVSTLAGIGEEISWRGVQFVLLGGVTGDPWTAALLTSVSFGLAHATQGWKSAAVIVLFGLGFQTLVWLGSSLYVAMAVHIAYDLTAGFTYGRLGRELNSGSKPSISNPEQSTS